MLLWSAINRSFLHYLLVCVGICLKHFDVFECKPWGVWCQYRDVFKHIAHMLVLLLNELLVLHLKNLVFDFRPDACGCIFTDFSLWLNIFGKVYLFLKRFEALSSVVGCIWLKLKHCKVMVIGLDWVRASVHKFRKAFVSD